MNGPSYSRSIHTDHRSSCYNPTKNITVSDVFLESCLEVFDKLQYDSTDITIKLELNVNSNLQSNSKVSHNRT